MSATGGPGAAMTMFKTVSGREVDLAAPDWRDIHLEDVARGLSQICRFAGQSRRAFCVAEHSLVVAQLAGPAWRLPALLHDAHEAFLGDWTQPAIEACGAKFSTAVERLRCGLDLAIARRVLADSDLDVPEGLTLAASELMTQMQAAPVRAADAEARALEDAVRGADALQIGTSPAISRAREFYGVCAPDAGLMMLDWMAAVSHAAQVWGRR